MFLSIQPRFYERLLLSEQSSTYLSICLIVYISIIYIY